MPNFAISLVAACLAVLATPVLAADPDALWKIVGGHCALSMTENGEPGPCARVDLARGFAVLKDNSPAKPEGYLLIPVIKIGGMEDPAILAPDAPNYWEDAWEARTLVAEKLHTDLPRDAIALAINSIYGRTQNQLHIHVDCVRADVRETLRHAEPAIGSDWSPLPAPIDGHPYRAMRVAGEDLSRVQPFALLAGGNDGGQTYRDHMGIETLVLIGATFADGSPGFYLLADRADLAAGDRASGEDLIDPSCAVKG